MSLKFPKPESRAGERADAKKLKEAQRRVIYRLVSKRDGHLCRNCKSKGPGLHHHHLRFRSQQGQDTTQNVLLLCGRCHSDIHGYRLAIEGDNADRLLRFVWSR